MSLTNPRALLERYLSDLENEYAELLATDGSAEQLRETGERIRRARAELEAHTTHVTEEDRSHPALKALQEKLQRDTKAR